MAPKKKTYRVSTEDKVTLEQWLGLHSQPRKMVFRSELLLRCDAGQSVESVARELETSTNTVYKWLKRYQKSGIHGINDLPRPGQPRKLSSKKIKEVLTLTQGKVPSEATRWSLRLMAKHAGITVWQVQQIWLEAGIKPNLLNRSPLLSAGT